MNTVQGRLDAGVRAAREVAALRAEVAELQSLWAASLEENRRLGQRNTKLADQLADWIEACGRCSVASTEVKP